MANQEHLTLLEHRGLQAQVTALRYGRSCDPGCPSRVRYLAGW